MALKELWYHIWYAAIIMKCYLIIKLCLPPGISLQARFRGTTPFPVSLPRSFRVIFSTSYVCPPPFITSIPPFLFALILVLSLWCTWIWGLARSAWYPTLFIVCGGHHTMSRSTGISRVDNTQTSKESTSLALAQLLSLLETHMKVLALVPILVFGQ